MIGMIWTRYDECPLLARSGHYADRGRMAASDPKRTFENPILDAPGQWQSISKPGDPHIRRSGPFCNSFADHYMYSQLLLLHWHGGIPDLRAQRGGGNAKPGSGSGLCFSKTQGRFQHCVNVLRLGAVIEKSGPER